mmetsp:Transcript_16140/g.22048  ORF Transcript_16140/g.22048 Transcript_16140/m.22048 type:complete len:81 (+) Transcript_16140:342-584(+)
MLLHSVRENIFTLHSQVCPKTITEDEDASQLGMEFREKHFPCPQCPFNTQVMKRFQDDGTKSSLLESAVVRHAEAMRERF